MSSHEYHLDGKVAAGPGGIRCTCCNGYHKGNSQKATKTAINRRVRRKRRQVDVIDYDELAGYVKKTYPNILEALGDD